MTWLLVALSPIHTSSYSPYFVGAGLLITIEFRSSLSERSISISLMMGERYARSCKRQFVLVQCKISPFRMAVAIVRRLIGMG